MLVLTVLSLTFPKLIVPVCSFMTLHSLTPRGLSLFLFPSFILRIFTLTFQKKIVLFSPIESYLILLQNEHFLLFFGQCTNVVLQSYLNLTCSQKTIFPAVSLFSLTQGL
jgi:hypothetical protein